MDKQGYVITDLGDLQESLGIDLAMAPVSTSCLRQRRISLGLLVYETMQWSRNAWRAS